jgi:ubiquinone/menaquinone biosynthesis C-methylase UbiE
MKVLEWQSKRGLRKGLKAYCQVRSLYFGAQYWALNRASQVLGFKTPIRYQDIHLLKLIHQGIDELFDADIRRIEEGIYPASVLKPQLNWEALLTLPKVVADGLRVGSRRTRGSAHEFSPEAQEYLEGLPAYYRRNFHFQTDGYLSARSAEVYDYEVDLLFSGATDAMRRLLIEPLKRHFKKAPDGKGLKFLEVGTGTGRATQFIKLAFPKAQIIGIDLSEPYLNVAKRKLRAFKGVNLLQGDGAHLPFKEGEFDAVYSAFLYHELPLEVRLEIIQESLRVLKGGGVLSYVDSIQAGDCPDFDFFLREFPKNFHEPFYMNYISNPMDRLMNDQPLQELAQGIGLLSKFGAYVKTGITPQ